MSGKIRIVFLVFMGASFVLFGALFIQRTEGSGGGPGDILLQVSLADGDQYRMTSDGAGPYIDGLAPAGSIVARILGPKRTQKGRFIMTVDNGGDPNGRSMNFLFNQLRNPCSACAWKETTDIPGDFPFDSAFEVRYVEFDSWGSTEPDSPFLFNFLTMENGRPYYVGMSIKFRVTLNTGTESNLYYLGFSGALVEVTALGSEGGQPTSWVLRSVDPSQFGDCNSYRDLVREYLTGKSKGVKYTNECYGWYYIPFEMQLYR